MKTKKVFNLNDRCTLQLLQNTIKHAVSFTMEYYKVQLQIEKKLTSIYQAIEYHYYSLYIVSAALEYRRGIGI